MDTTGIIIFASAMLALGTSGCARGPKTRNEHLDLSGRAPVSESVEKVAQAIVSDDARAFASMVDYPLERPYPLRNVEDFASMVDYYRVMVDDSIRNVVRESRRTDWNEAGWRGWTLDAGQYIWIEGKVYSYPYLSEAEKRLLIEAVELDISTLPPDLGSGWRPVMAVADDAGCIYRLDSEDASDRYRMMRYRRKRLDPARPEKIFVGDLERQGTEQNRLFTLRNGSETLIFMPDDSGEGMKLVSNTGGRSATRIVRSVHWTDYVK